MAAQKPSPGRMMREHGLIVWAIITVIIIARIVLGRAINDDDLSTVEADQHQAVIVSVHFIDTDSGEVALIQTDTKAVLIDAGPELSGSQVVDYLRRQDISGVDVVVITNPDAAHVGGLYSILMMMPVHMVVDGAWSTDAEPYGRVLETVGRLGIEYVVGSAGLVFCLEEAVELEVLWPPEQAGDPCASDEADLSPALRLQAGAVTMLFVNGISPETELGLVRTYGEALAADLIKMSGGRNSATGRDELLMSVLPRLAVVSGDPDHPDSVALKDRLERMGVDVYDIRSFGTIIIHTDGRTCVLVTEH